MSEEEKKRKSIQTLSKGEKSTTFPSDFVQARQFFFYL